VLRWLVLLGSALSLVLSALLAGHSLTVGSAEGGWVYPYAGPLSFAPVVVSAVAIGIAAVLVGPTWRSDGRHDWQLLMAWIIAATALHGLIRAVAPHTLESLFTSDTANSFHSVAQQYEPADVLRRFLRIRSQVPLHAQSNMPGKVILIQGLQAITVHTAALPWLLVVLSNAGAVFMYLFVRTLFLDGKMALLAAALYLFTPGRLFFFPLMNSVTPVWILGCACLLVAWLRSGATVYAALLGVALYATAFFEPLPLAAGLLFAALSLRANVLRQITWERFAVQTAVVLGAFVATSEAVQALTGFELIQAFRQIGRHAVAFNEASGRPYAVWVLANLREFTVGAGACALLLTAATMAEGWPRADGTPREKWGPIVTVSAGLLATLVTLDLLGVNRGEVVRLWIFLACLFQIPVAYACARIDSRAIATLVLAVTILHATIGTALVRFAVP
jgi:hypothetical protein